jgi:hypothetical protein
MWPFKKKKSAPVPTKEFETVICIPGTWSSREEFILQIMNANNGEYLAAGVVLMNVKEKKHFIYEFCEHDDRMMESFEYAGRVNEVSKSFLTEIERHKHVIYIRGASGSPEAAHNIAKAASAVLKAGGIGIKIETAGKAFEKSRWTMLSEEFNLGNLYKMFVIDSITDNQNGSTFSCGMHNLGLKDTIIYNEEFQASVDLIRIFGVYQLVDRPVIIENQTFSTEVEAPRFRIIAETNQFYKDHDLFGNPFGMWRLERI